MRRWALLWWLLCAGCGEPIAALWVRIEAPLLVPDECDGLRLTARRLADSSQVFDQRYDLTAGPPFPLELALTTRNRANLGEGALSLGATALYRGETARPWAERSQLVTLREDRVTETVIQLCDCPP
ncbi:MAG: hypothetical protein HYZ28_16275 [Myxococcales bacterium]|nr:hypothetical protein [Myxococcales bacterium]